jgi:transposase
LRPADADSLTRFDLGAQAGNRPVRPVGNRLFEQGRDHAQRGFALHRRQPRRDARLQRIHTAPAKIAAPQPNRVLPHTERFRDLRTAPAGQGQQHRACPVCLPAITRPCESRQGHALFIARHNRRFAAHAPPTRIGASSESPNHGVGQPTGICFAARSHWLTVEWLPKYAPELNDIEVVWHDLKAHHLAHQTFTDVAALDHAIHTAVQDLNRERMAVPLAKLRISA